MTAPRDPASDPFDLARFVTAQDGVWDDARRELAAGAKRSHWMWFVFPQIQGLGRSAMAERYAVRSLAEAKAYLAHETLGDRLREATELASRHTGTPLSILFGAPDDMKFVSSMTLFEAATREAAANRPDPFGAALDAWDAARDAATLERLARF